MTFRARRGLWGMSDRTQAPSTISNIGVVMFTVSDVDAAIAFYTEKLGFEVRADQSFGENDEQRWIEVAPPGSTARLSLNPPMGNQPGGGTIGVETPDVRAEHERLTAMDGVDVDPELMAAPGVPPMFRLADPDGNDVWVVETPAA